MELKNQKNGSLVISEFHYHQPPAWMSGGVVGYFWFYWYIELYNNSDTTIYLDGKIVGRGFNYHLDATLWPCAETEPFRNEPRGMWSRLFQAFPGSGHDYPVAPGKTVLTAKLRRLDQLYPAPSYYDMVNVNWYPNEPSERLAVLTTFVLDPANPDLGFSRATKAEGGLEAEIGSAVLSAVAYRQRLTGGVGSEPEPGFLLRDHYALQPGPSGEPRRSSSRRTTRTRSRY